MMYFVIDNEGRVVTDDLDRDFAEMVAAELGGYVISAEIRWDYKTKKNKKNTWQIRNSVI